MSPKRGPVAQSGLTVVKNGEKFLTKEELLSQMGERRETFSLPNGGKITLRSIDVQSGFDFFGGGSTQQDIADRTKKICLLGIVEPQLSLEDLTALDNARFGIVEKLAQKIMELSGAMGVEAATFLTPVPA